MWSQFLVTWAACCDAEMAHGWEIQVLPLAGLLTICVTLKAHFPWGPEYCKKYLGHWISRIPFELSCLVRNSGSPSEGTPVCFKETGSDHMQNKIHCMYWVGPKVCFGFSITANGKSQMNFWANPILSFTPLIILFLC